ncbi:hypothetical protein [Roseibium sp.]|uniref:hypothetical protein n=1 Tax=Roseibium sp. TaxID=1936156 RepID=UPI003A979C58
MSKRIATVALIGALTASGAAFAQGIAFGSVDGDQDGFVSYEELTKAVPSISEEIFMSADKDSDKLLSQEEFAALEL